MLFGVSVPAASAAAAADVGFDFVELRVSELDPEDRAGTWPKTSRTMQAAGIPALTYNFFLPADLRVVGPDIDNERLRRYVACAAERASTMGGRTFVFGSGAARRVPDGYPTEDALADYRTAAAIAGEEADRFGMGIAIEPLNRTEANLLATVEEATRQAQLIARPNIGVLADSYHMHMEAEPFHHLLTAVGLRHVQLCDTGRMPPGLGHIDFGGFFIFLNQAGYDATVAIESAFSNFAAQAPRALETVKTAAALRGELNFAA